MTRIDPKQLLSTLSVLLAPDGGIRSVEEVPRIVQLMQKFSKKLVSKCIYIHILRSSSPELLEQFLSLKGWDLLNSWFSEGLKNTNYYLCGDLVKLFALCPMTAKRLSENSDKNQAPKLIRQLSCDNRIEAEIRNLSLQVIQQWMSVARSAPKNAPPRPQSPLELHPIPDVDDDYSEDYVPPTKKMKPKPKPKLEKKPKNPPKSAMTKKPAKSRIIMDSESESESEKPRGKVARMGSVSSAGEEDKISKPKPLTAKEIRLQLLNDDSDVDELLMTDSEDDLIKKTEVIKKVEKKKEVIDLKLKEKHLREKEREFKRRKERERERREQKAKPYSRTELRKELENGEKDKIKKIAERLKEENKGKSLTAGLGRIPKLPKKEPVAAKNGNSFDSILGSMDVKPKSVKVPPMKNKNKDLLNSLAGSPDKPKSKSAIEKENIAKEKRREEEREARRREEEEEKRLEEERREEKECEDRLKEEEEKRLQEEKEEIAKEEKEKEEKAKEEKVKEERELKRKEEKEEKKRAERRKEEKHKDKLPKAEKLHFERRDSNSSDSGRSEKKSDKIRFGEKPRSGEKRPSIDDSPKVKKVVTVIKESNMFGDVLSSIMNDDKEKIKKRKIAERRAERKAKEQEESRKRDEKRKEDKERKKDEKEKIDEKEVKNDKVEKSPSSSPEPVTQDENNSEEVPFGGPDREVKGILIYARGFKNKKKLSWTPDNNLVKIEYFDCDETERTNVYKQKMTFVEMKQKEKEMEKMKLNEKPEAAWTLIPLDFKHPVEYGNESKEREVQSEREMRVLCSFYLENQLPQDPTEPEPCKPSDIKPKPIPQIDLNSGSAEGADDSTTDFAPAGWPTILKGGSQEPLSDFDRLRGPDPVVEEPVKPAATKLSDILSTFKPGLLEDIVRMTSMSKSETNEKSTKPEIQLPANFNVPPPNFTSPPAAPHQYPESDRGHHNNHNYRHRRGPMRSGHGDRPFPYAGQPCKFWMDKGNCIKGDRCPYSHPSHPPRNGFKY